MLYTVDMKPVSASFPTRAQGRNATRQLCFAAACVALLTVCSWVSIPVFSVPFTLQTFAVFFTIGLLGTKWGFWAILAYVGLGALGVPVFSGMTGGIGRLAGVTGGYILGFLAACPISGPLLKAAKDKPLAQFGAMLAGLVVCYAVGTVWFVFVAGNTSVAGLGAALMACVVPFVPADAVKLALAVVLLARLRPLLRRGEGVERETNMSK